MRKKINFDHILIGLFIGAATMVVLIGIVIAAIPHNRTSDTKIYDVECVAGRSRDSLKGCVDGENIKEKKCYRTMQSPYAVKIETDCE